MSAVASATWEALGTGAAVFVSEAGTLARARAVVEAEIAAIDRACSRFREDSELAALNRRSGRRTAVSETFATALGAGLRAARLTAGRVDPTVGEAIELAGYDRDFADLPAEGPAVVSVARVPGWRAVELDRAAGTVRMRPGVRLDLGATAKALAADRAAQAAHELTGCGVLVSLGGDLAAAGDAPADDGWRVRVTDDHAAGWQSPGQTVSIHDGGLATSSTTVRRWVRGGVAQHHILDPATGQPAGVTWRTVSVAAASCVDANTASTAAIVHGADAPGWLASLGLPARLVRPDGEVVTVGGWPAEEPS